MKSIIQIHVPRTAGISMFKYIESSGMSTQNLSRGLFKLDPAIAFTSIRHKPALALIENDYMDQDWWENAFKFAFVRNTWDRVVSIYEYYRSFRLRRKSCVRSNVYLANFDIFVKEVIQNGMWVQPTLKRLIVTRPYFDHVLPQMTWLQWGVDFVGRFDKLNTDWKTLCGLAGIQSGNLGKYNASKRKDYRSYYTDELQGIVADRYADEINEFEFTF